MKYRYLLMCFMMVLAFHTIDNNIAAQYDITSITGATEVPVVFNGETQRLDEYIEDTTIVHPITRPPRDGYHPKHDWPLHPVTNPNALPIGNDPVWQSNNSQTTGLQNSSRMPVGVNFDGMNALGIGVGDPTMDAGPNHVIQMINDLSGARFMIWDKQGVALTANVQFDTFFGFPSGFGDPIVLYDHEADRWLLSEFEVKFAQNRLFIAISTSPDPLGTWYTYTIQNAQFPDYPKYAVWPDMYVVTTNEFNQCGFFALDRVSMLAGTAHNAQRFTTGEFGVTDFFLASSPVHWDGNTPPPADSPALAMRMKDDGWAGVASDGLEFWELDIDFNDSNNSTLSLVQDLAVAPFSSNLCSFTDWSCIQQPNGAISLDPLLEVLMNRVQYRNFGSHESIVCCHAVDVDGNDRAGIRWYELRRNGGNWSVYQQGTYSPDNTGRWMGTIAMDDQGNIALGYNISGVNMFPSIKYTGRFADSPLGQMTWPETTIVLGTGVHTTNRYGDYNQMAWDPSSNSFWMTAMYNDAVWKTRIASFNVPPGGCTDATACNFDASADLDDGSCVYCGSGNCVNLTLMDSYGDGWNGAYWEFLDEMGVSWANGTLASGYEFTETFCLNSGCYNFAVETGSWPSEVSWELVGANGGVITGGASESMSVSFGDVDGCTNPIACNYDPDACIDDGSCDYYYSPPTNLLDTEWYIEYDWGCDGDPGNVVATLFSDFTYESSLGTTANWSLCGLYITLLYENGTEYNGDYNLAGGYFEGTINGGPSCFTMWPVVEGCTDITACNYNAYANVDDGSCNNVAAVVDMTGANWLLDYDANCAGGGIENSILTLFYADNTWAFIGYSDNGWWTLCGSYLEVWNGAEPVFIGEWSWEDFAFSGLVYDNGVEVGCGVLYLQVEGCTDAIACNYDASANTDDGSCLYPICNDPLACNYDECSDPISVCYDAAACYDASACTYAIGWSIGCTYIDATNYDPTATVDDGSCVYLEFIDNCGEGTFYDEESGMCLPSVSICSADITGDGNVNVEDLLLMLAQFGDVCI